MSGTHKRITSQLSRAVSDPLIDKEKVLNWQFHLIQHYIYLM